MTFKPCGAIRMSFGLWMHRGDRFARRPVAEPSNRTPASLSCRGLAEVLRGNDWGILLGVGRGKIYALAAIVVLAVSLTAFAMASAKPGYVTFPAERKSQLSVKGSGGFQITIARIDNRVELTASNGSSAAIYVVRPPRMSADQIRATFPGVGRISVRFHALGRVKRWPAFCGGRPSMKRDGVFRGVIRFKGEQGFTRVVTGQARGFVSQSFKETCKGSGHGNSSTSPVYALTERSKSPAGQLVFAALRPIEGSPFAGTSSYFASQSKRKHGMVSLKVASARGNSNAFEIAGSPSQPTSAVVTPPAPFRGTASFKAVPGGFAEWAGTLAVDLPGVGTVQLTAPRFTPELCLGKHCVGRPTQ